MISAPSPLGRGSDSKVDAGEIDVVGPPIDPGDGRPEREGVMDVGDCWSCSETRKDWPGRNGWARKEWSPPDEGTALEETAAFGKACPLA